MAFRIEKRIGALLMLTAAAWAQPLTYQVRHKHLHGGAIGTLRVEDDAISFDEKGKHSRQWKFEDIQQLSLSSARLRILTYEDQKLLLGRDREYVFDRLPADLTKQSYAPLRSKLGQRFVAGLAETDIAPLWQVGAKLRHGLSGYEGKLTIGADRVVFETKASAESRTWLFHDIDNVSTAGPYDLVITTPERAGWLHAGPTEFRFQLKERLSEDRYNEIWRGISYTHR
jgi:hypothetical protein